MQKNASAQCSGIFRPLFNFPSCSFSLRWWSGHCLCRTPRKIPISYPFIRSAADHQKQIVCDAFSSAVLFVWESVALQLRVLMRTCFTTYLIAAFGDATAHSWLCLRRLEIKPKNLRPAGLFFIARQQKSQTRAVSLFKPCSETKSFHINVQTW